MRVLGIDPGLTRCGVAVVDGGQGLALSAVHIGVIRTDTQAHIGQRLLDLETELEGIVASLQPDAIAVERVFSQHNVSTVMPTAQAAAIALLVAARRGISVSMHTPTEVKAAVTGSGRASKDQVATMVMKLLRLSQAPHPADAADAAAIAICHAWRGTAQARLSAARDAQAALNAPNARSSIVVVP